MLVAEWKQVSTALFQHLVESLPRRVEAVIVAKGGTNSILTHDFGMTCSRKRCPHTLGYVVYEHAWLTIIFIASGNRISHRVANPALT
jgi:hypothetical protein